MAKPDLILYRGPTVPDLLIHRVDPMGVLHGIILRMDTAREHFTRLGGSVICVRPEGTVRITLTPQALELHLSAHEAGAPALRTQFAAFSEDVVIPLSSIKEACGETRQTGIRWARFILNRRISARGLP